MSERFAGKVVVVTGGASGIGLAAARAFADEGARVALADRDLDKARAAAAGIRSAGGEAVAVCVDIADFASCEAMVSEVVSTFGGLNIAFNNAGIPSAFGADFDDITVVDWDQLIGVNLTGLFFSMKAEVPALKRNASSVIVNTGSIRSLVAASGRPAYVASKHGVAGLTKAAALDLIPHGIRVNAVCPGFIATPMLAPVVADTGLHDQIVGGVPIARLGTADEVAQAVLFLASDESSYLVGSLLSVDGGLATL
ncbi:MAG: short-chain dehydrogenase [Subtercola sp.]|nr:short-chain dehydrogenase [Subtercola sp.]